jgi:hypothetical protein
MIALLAFGWELRLFALAADFWWGLYIFADMPIWCIAVGALALGAVGWKIMLREPDWKGISVFVSVILVFYFLLNIQSGGRLAQCLGYKYSYLKRNHLVN